MLVPLDLKVGEICETEYSRARGWPASRSRWLAKVRSSPDPMNFWNEGEAESRSQPASSRPPMPAAPAPIRPRRETLGRLIGGPPSESRSGR